MKTSERRTGRSGRHARLTVGLLVVLLAGCASSPPSSFYQLSPFQKSDSITSDASRKQDLIIAIGPVRIPDYLDRPQIVTRTGENELTLSEFHRWAGSLESDVVRVLAENLSELLAGDHFHIVRWTPYQESQLSASYGVEVLMERFEGTRGESVLLKAHWAISAHGKNVLLRRESLINEQVQGDSYDAVVAAMSRALERLSQDITGGIRSVLQEEHPGG